MLCLYQGIFDMYTLFLGKLILPYPRTIYGECLVAVVGNFLELPFQTRTAVARKIIVKLRGENKRFRMGFDLLI